MTAVFSSSHQDGGLPGLLFLQNYFAGYAVHVATEDFGYH
jgi:hypothetical protein